VFFPCLSSLMCICQGVRGGQGPEHMYLHVEVLGEMMDLLVPMGRVPFLDRL